MVTHDPRVTARVVILSLSLVAAADAAGSSQTRIEAALTNIMTLQRPGEDGVATIWDGNKYVQCRWPSERTLRCEAAGTLMQPSLGHIVTPDRIARLSAL